MKKSVLIFALIVLSCLNAKSRDKKKLAEDSLSCLELSGRIVNTKKDRGVYRVQLISFNKVIDSLEISDKKEFRFMLKRNAHYAVRISKPGYVTRIVSVYTNVPEALDVIYRFQFDTELIDASASKSLDSDALDFPIAVISFHPSLNNFYYSEEYTSSLKRQLYLRQVF